MRPDGGLPLTTSATVRYNHRALSLHAGQRDVFISHAASDAGVANAICRHLEENGVACWIAPRDIIPGSSWGEAILNAISAAHVMVVVLSEHANVSPHLLREVERAVDKACVTVPFRVQDVAPNSSLEYFLSLPHRLDAFTRPMEEHIRQLSQTVRAILGSRKLTDENTKLPVDHGSVLIAQFDEFAPDDWSRRPPNALRRFLAYLFADR